jgi:hypothetical protein
MTAPALVVSLAETSVFMWLGKPASLEGIWLRMVTQVGGSVIYLAVKLYMEITKHESI